jgi:hypothetical protein
MVENPKGPLNHGQEPLIGNEGFPYFGQWESRELIWDFVRGTRHPSEDPKWPHSGAASATEYATWSRHLCGMACLKMILARTHHRAIPIMELKRQCQEFGGYVVDGGSIRGLVYAPFVRFVSGVYGLSARVLTGGGSREVLEVVNRGSIVLASVHHTIRDPSASPPRKGGHLVLVHACDPRSESLIFHNPSGHTVDSQENARLTISVFEKFYARRAIEILGAT